MPAQNLSFFNPFLNTKRKNHITVEVITPDTLLKWKETQETSITTQCSEQGFEGKSGQLFRIKDSKGNTTTLIAGANNDSAYIDGSKIYDAIKTSFSNDLLKSTSFALVSNTLAQEPTDQLHIGWGWAAYQFIFYKKEKNTEQNPALLIHANADKKRIKAYVESVCLLRDLVNIPANDMGPDELESATKFLTTAHDVSLKVIKDKALIKQNFPMIYDVGKGSARRPRLLDFSWGDKKHPSVTLVGKGVCFDTGGYDIKPSQFMINMKKDMGGSAHVLGLAHLIMCLNLPINLRVLIPAVENSISGEAYRPSDILNSRKGITVEVGNTDAEGRLVLADTLTYACEEKPELLIDFATLTGAARVALGLELPALFSNTQETAQAIQKQSQGQTVQDPVWNLPLWAPYRKELDCSAADISSTGGKAGATTAALFLQEFIDNSIEWIHMDVYSWADSTTTGRPKGGADTGMRAIFSFLEDRYGK